MLTDTKRRTATNNFKDLLWTSPPHENFKMISGTPLERVADEVTRPNHPPAEGYQPTPPSHLLQPPD